LHESTTCENTTWIPMICSLFRCCLLSRSTLLISLTKHLKCFLDHHFHVSLPSTTLGLPTHRWQAPTLGRSDLSPKNHSWYLLELTLLIDPSDGLHLMNNHKSLFKSFSFYLFESFFFLPNDLQMSLELKHHLHSGFGLDLPIWVPNVCQIHSTIKWPCTLCLSCF
jgi:hypothetical protein